MEAEGVEEEEEEMRDEEVREKKRMMLMMAAFATRTQNRIKRWRRGRATRRMSERDSEDEEAH